MALPNHYAYDLSSPQLPIRAGQQVPRHLVERVAGIGHGMLA